MHGAKEKEMNLPSEFVERTRALVGEEDFRLLESAWQEEAPVSIRVNRAKCDVPVPGGKVPWSSSGVYLGKRPAFTFDPLFHAGCYYVQEASSMFVERVLETFATEPVVMLDLCAAPGGKSTASRAVLPEGSLLVANEVMRNRVQVLAENLIKWGHAETVVTCNDPSDFAALPGLFDIILADVPCSGEGMFRKDRAAVEEWSVENVRACSLRQRRIVADVWRALKSGGLLVYSTCTYNREENEENVAWIARELGAEVLEVPVRSEWGITGNLAGSGFPVYRFLPHRTKGEGFFLAVLRKTEDGSRLRPKEMPKGKKGNWKEEKGRQRAGTVPEEVKGRLCRPDDFLFDVRGTAVSAFPKAHQAVYALLRQALKVVHAGVELGEMKGKDWIPSHSLAMSTALQKASFPCAEVGYEQAIAYLRKEAVAFGADVPKGYVLLRYKEVPLGFAKNIGNRANNLYPPEWRIRSGHVPDAPLSVW